MDYTQRGKPRGLDPGRIRTVDPPDLGVGVSPHLHRPRPTQRRSQGLLNKTKMSSSTTLDLEIKTVLCFTRMTSLHGPLCISAVQVSSSRAN